MKPVKLLLASMLCVLYSGCASYRSTIMTRIPSDQIVRENPKSVRGVPVTLKVPTHVEVKIVEEYFILQHDSKTEIPKLNKSLRRVETTTIYTPKVMTVDMARPLAGSLAIGGDNDSNGIVFDQAGYFETIQGKVDDQTFEDLNTAIPSLKKLLAAPTASEAAEIAAKGTNTKLGGWHSYHAVIALRRFDINEPCWEEEVQAFISQHLHCQEALCFPQ